MSQHQEYGTGQDCWLLAVRIPEVTLLSVMINQLSLQLGNTRACDRDEKLTDSCATDPWLIKKKTLYSRLRLEPVSRHSPRASQSIRSPSLVLRDARLLLHLRLDSAM